jgi:hypothetical protein
MRIRWNYTGNPLPHQPLVAIAFVHVHASLLGHAQMREQQPWVMAWSETLQFHLAS